MNGSINLLEQNQKRHDMTIKQRLTKNDIIYNMYTRGDSPMKNFTLATNETALKRDRITDANVRTELQRQKAVEEMRNKLRLDQTVGVKKVNL